MPSERHIMLNLYLLLRSALTHSFPVAFWETHTQPLPIPLSSSSVFPMKLSRWVRVSARDHLSPNYLVITPHSCPQFTGPSHQVLFLPRPTYLPTYFPTFVIMIWDRNLWLNHFYHLNLDTYPPPNTQVQTNFGLFLSVPFSSPTQSRLIDHRTKYFHDLNTSLHVRYISG